MNVLLLYFSVVSIALFLLYFVKRPKLWFIEKLRQKAAKEYVEYVPFSQRYFQGFRERYIVLKGLIRQGNQMFNGWYVYDIQKRRYVDPDLSVYSSPAGKAHAMCDKLNEEENLYREQISLFAKSDNKSL
jgi:hypothetical protein